MSKNAKKDDIESLIAALKKEGVLTSAEDIEEIEKIPTGIYEVDEILGGGFARGRIVDLYGQPGSGKSAIALKFLANAQNYGICVFIDLENAFDIEKARSSGIETSKLVVATPESAEDTFELIRQFAQTPGCAAIVIDSMAGLSPSAELAGDVGDAHVGLVGRIVSQSMRLIKGDLQKNETVLVGINQVRENIGGMGYGPSTTPTGGKAFKFYASTRLNVARISAIKQGDDVIGQTIQVKTDKSRLSPPFQKATFDLYYDFGISNESQILERALDTEIIRQSGAWFTNTLTGEKLAQGKVNAIRALIDDPETTKEILEALDS